MDDLNLMQSTSRLDGPERTFDPAVCGKIVSVPFEARQSIRQKLSESIREPEGAGRKTDEGN